MPKQQVVLQLSSDVQSHVSSYYKPEYNKKGELEGCSIIQSIKSPALFFNKFMPSPTPEQKQLKESFLRELARRMQTEELRDLVERVRTRLEDQLCALQKSIENPPFVIDCIDRQVVWRMVVGLGTANVLETSMTLHRLYGFPYIPASAVKGITHSYAFWQIADEFKITDEDSLKKLYELLMETDRKKQSKSITELGLEEKRQTKFNQAVEQYQRIFGTTVHQGSVIFFDALPLELPKLELDIMNPHYSKYYDGTEPPADWLEPVPITFLTVGKGAGFRFYWASQDTTLLPIVRSWLQAAVSDVGVGAKTRAGYGELSDPATRSASGGQGGTATAAVDPSAQLEASIARWKSSEMGSLPQLVESIAKISDVERRRQLAQQLQQKLKETGKWTRNYKESSWYQKLEELLGGTPDERT